MQARTMERPTFSRAQQQQRTMQMGQLQEEVQGAVKDGGKEKRGLGINQVILVGRLTEDPKTVETRTSTKTTLRLATNEKAEHPEFHAVVLWGAVAQTAALFLTKGRLVMVMGRIHHSEWEDKEGVKHRSDEVQAYSVQFLDRPMAAEDAA